MQSYWWAQAVIYQGERLFTLFENEIETDILNRGYEEYQQIRIITMMDEHFFAIALGKSIDYLQLFSEYNHIISDIDKLFSLRNIHNLRNKREHDDEYLYPNGRNVNKRPGFEFVLSGHSGDMTSAYVSPTVYYLGNVEIRSIVKYYKNKIEEIRSIYDTVIDSLLPDQDDIAE